MTESRICKAVGWAILGAVVAAAVSPAAPQGAAIKLPSNDQVIAFLLQSIDWYQHADRQMATDPNDLLFLDNNHPIAVQIVRLSFDFAKQDAAMSPAVAPSNERTTIQAGSPSSDFARYIAQKQENEEAIRKATQDVNEVKNELVTARGADRKKLQTALDDAQSRLNLLRAASETLQNVLGFMQSVGGGKAQDGDLASVIDNLGQTVPEVSNSAMPTAKLSTQEMNSRAASTQGSGIAGPLSEVLAVRDKVGAINETTRLTNNLASSAENLRTTISSYISRAVQSGALSNIQDADLSSLQQQKTQLDALTAELKAISPAILALSKQDALLAVYQSHLGERRATVASQYRQAWRSLIVRLVIVLLSIVLLIITSEVLRRLISHHVQDENRRRLMIMAQWVATLVVCIVIAAVGLASDLSSFATFFGLLTAGVAVALQNVILAAVGYLLLVGKRGIRIGDRVRISGITGEVSDMGLLQFQLKEFDLQKQQYTGQVATFSNSLVFVSPASALLKLNRDAPEHVEEPTDPKNSMSVRDKGSGLSRPS